MSQLSICFATMFSAEGRATTRREVNMDGMICGFRSEQHGEVVHPVTSSGERFPVVAYAHGWMAGGPALNSTYTDLWDLIASSGYVVVAFKAGLFNYCKNEQHDLLHALEWARTSADIQDLVDLDLPSAIAGHSMGGRATVLSASRADRMRELNVAAAVAQHPAVNVGGCPGCEPGVPILYTTADGDWTVPPKVVRAQYDATSQALPAAFVEVRGANHHDCSTDADLQGAYVVDWLDCFVKGDAAACTRAQCGEGDVPTVTCESRGFPSRESLESIAV